MRARDQEIRNLLLFGTEAPSSLGELAHPSNVPLPKQGWTHLQGISSGNQVLQAIGSSFDELRKLAQIHEKPLLDVGANASTFSAEGALNGVPIFATDLKFETYEKRALKELEKRLHLLKEEYASGTYTDITTGKRITPQNWETTVQNIMKQVSEQYSECSADSIVTPQGKPARDRHYSAVIAHHSVPQYCTEAEFMHLILPELLRVTEDTLFVHPMQYGGTSLSIDSIEISRIADTATNLGFEASFFLSPSEAFPNALTGVFKRA